MTPVLSVEIEDPKTWPKDFCSLAQNSRGLLIDYHCEQKRINKLLKCSSPENKYKDEYKSIVEKLDAILNAHNIVGYHCTRLTSEEIKEIKTSGMQELSKNLIENRLSEALSQNYMEQKNFDYLQKSEVIESHLDNEQGDRTGMIWFSLNPATLKDCCGVSRFFKSWGGEALYNGHEDDGNICGTIQSIGKPCIVKCSIPVVDVKHCHASFSEHFLSFLFSKDIAYTNLSAECDMFIEKNLNANEVLAVIECSNPLFKELINYDNWNDCCSGIFDT